MSRLVYIHYYNHELVIKLTNQLSTSLTIEFVHKFNWQTCLFTVPTIKFELTHS